jgi:hypothetical protein
VLTALLWWLMLFGVWPLADPGHSLGDGPLVWLDLALHFGAGWMLLDREIERRAEARAKPDNGSSGERVKGDG